MDVDAITHDLHCFRCGKTDGHMSRECTTPVEEIYRKYGCNSMFVPGGRRMQNHGTKFANVGEYLNVMSQEQREELVHAL